MPKPHWEKYTGTTALGCAGHYMIVNAAKDCIALIWQSYHSRLLRWQSEKKNPKNSPHETVIKIIPTNSESVWLIGKVGGSFFLPGVYIYPY